MPWYQCPVSGCDYLSRKPERCPTHSTQQGKGQRERRHHEVRYSQARWQKVRRAYGAKYPLCEMCLGRGVTKVKDLIHHIVAIADGGDWYRYDNLMSLCNECHGKEHPK
jgi:5-methylcytosine-specific restriction protein A